MSFRCSFYHPFSFCTCFFIPFFLFTEKKKTHQKYSSHISSCCIKTTKFCVCLTFCIFSQHLTCCFLLLSCSLDLLLYLYQVMSVAEVARVARKVRSAFQQVASAIETHANRLSVEQLFGICASTTASEIGRTFNRLRWLLYSPRTLNYHLIAC